MKIVSKAELQQMPKGTPFAEYEPKAGWPQEFLIFVAPCGYIDDFYYRSVSSPENSGTDQLIDREREMAEAGASYPVETDIDREGLHDPDLRYLVWEPEDVARIINLLQGGDDPRDTRED